MCLEKISPEKFTLTTIALRQGRILQKNFGGLYSE